MQKRKLDSNPVQQLTITFKKAFSLAFIIYEIEEIIPIFMGCSELNRK